MATLKQVEKKSDDRIVFDLHADNGRFLEEVGSYPYPEKMDVAEYSSKSTAPNKL